MNSKNNNHESNLRHGSRNGRPALPENEKLSIVRHTRFNEAENAVLLANVRRAGLGSVSEYIRRVSLNPKIVPRMSESEMTLARYLSGMSNNFNQLVRLCHQHGMSAMTLEVRDCLEKFRILFAKFDAD